MNKNKSSDFTIFQSLINNKFSFLKRIKNKYNEKFEYWFITSTRRKNKIENKKFPTRLDATTGKDITIVSSRFVSHIRYIKLKSKGKNLIFLRSLLQKMAERRKLLNDVDRTLKKITEGIETFEGTLEKYHHTTNPSQRDKLGEDLKKEIKKLQRSRDMVKQWQSGNDVKDKDRLLQARQSIEVQMEVFKNVERENKSKGSESNKYANLDPEEKARLESRDLMESLVERLKEKSAENKQDILDLKTGRTRSRNQDGDEEDDNSSNGKKSAATSRKAMRKNKRDKKGDKKANKSDKSDKGSGSGSSSSGSKSKNGSSGNGNQASTPDLEEVQLDESALAKLGELEYLDEKIEFHRIHLSVLIRMLDNGTCTAAQIDDQDVINRAEDFVLRSGLDEDDCLEIPDNDQLFEGLVDETLVAEMTEGSQAAIAQINATIVPESIGGIGSNTTDTQSVSLSSHSNPTIPDTPTSNYSSSNPTFMSSTILSSLITQTKTSEVDATAAVSVATTNGSTTGTTTLTSATSATTTNTTSTTNSDKTTKTPGIHAQVYSTSTDSGISLSKTLQLQESQVPSYNDAANSGRSRKVSGQSAPNPADFNGELDSSGNSRAFSPRLAGNTPAANSPGPNSQNGSNVWSSKGRSTSLASNLKAPGTTGKQATPQSLSSSANSAYNSGSGHPSSQNSSISPPPANLQKDFSNYQNAHLQGNGFNNNSTSNQMATHHTHNSHAHEVTQQSYNMMHQQEQYSAHNSRQKQHFNGNSNGASLQSSSNSSSNGSLSPNNHNLPANAYSLRNSRKQNQYYTNEEPRGESGIWGGWERKEKNEQK